MITESKMSSKADSIGDLYADLEQQIFFKIIDTLNTSQYNQVDQSNVLLWQAEQLAKMGALTDETIQLLSRVTGKAAKDIKQMVIDNGLQITDETNSQLAKLTGKRPKIMPDNHEILNGLLNQVFTNLDNVVNETLISRNTQSNPALKAYRDIISQSTIETVSGLKTHERAVNDAVYNLVKSGLKTNLNDRGNHNWSLEGYARTVVNTTASRVFNDTRLNSMTGFGVTLVVMSSHPMSRPACAPIQGHVLNQVPRSDPHFDPEFDTLYDHGYGEPSGVRGINCHHSLYPFVKGVSSNPFKQYDPDEVIKNGQIQQKQRALERNVRQDKKLLAVSQHLNDEVGINHYKNMLASHRSKLRKIVADNKYLFRDYSREKVMTPFTKEQVNQHKDQVAKRANELKTLHAEFGRHGLPQTVDEYRKVLYNKRSNQGLHGYVSARRRGVIEPVYTYKDYQTKYDELASNLIGVNISDGLTITGFSNHAVDRSLGALQDASHGNNKRIAIPTSDIQEALINGDVVKNKRGFEYSTDRVKVPVSFKGKIITIMPQRRKLQ